MLCKKGVIIIKNQEVLKRILIYFGEQAQLIKFLEEIGELISAYAELTLGIGTKEHVIEETADLIIVGSQLTLIDDRPLEYGIEVDMIKVLDFLAIAMSAILHDKKDKVDIIKTAISIARKMIVQMGYEQELDTMIDLKLKRTVKYIEIGRYKSILD